MTTVLVIVAALVLDRLAGEPRRLHPLVGFGRIATALERRLYGDSAMRGAVAVALLVAPFALAAGLARLTPLGAVIDAALLYLAIGWRSLEEHARRVAAALASGDLLAARERVGQIVSRDTAAMAPGDIAKAAVESVLENGNDAVFGAIFWFAVAGAPGAVAYRLANTLDAMWGYRNVRYSHFGWAAARLDDLLNYLPARLTALTYAALGKTRLAAACWREQAPAWDSPNAGPVMAAGAGALNVAIGGPARYAGEWHERPILGAGAAPVVEDIERALRLVRHGVALWLGVLLIGGLAHA